jgi:hypothetical protein
MLTLMRIRQRSAFVILFTLLTFSTACGGIAFDVGQDLPEQRVPGSPLGELLPSFIPTPIPLTIDLRAETEARNTGPARSAQLKRLTLYATPRASPSGNFDFLSEVRIHVAARNNSSLPRVEIARIAPVGKGLTALEFDIVPNVDLLPYINAGAEISATASGTQPRNDFAYAGHIDITVRI